MPVDVGNGFLDEVQAAQRLELRQRGFADLAHCTIRNHVSYIAQHIVTLFKSHLSSFNPMVHLSRLFGKF
jgi:hypothetical protein